MLVVAGGEGVDDAAADPALVTWVQARAAKARRTASVCTCVQLPPGSRWTATHSSRFGELAKHYPAVQVEPDPIFAQDGPIWTSAGVPLASMLRSLHRLVDAATTSTIKERPQEVGGIQTEGAEEAA